MDLNLLSVEEARALDQKIVQSEHIVIVAHSRPDGDAIGSSLAWADYLVSHYGKQPAVIVPNAFPDFLHWLPGCERIMRYDKYPAEIKAVLDEADLLFILDLNQLLRTEDMEEALASCKAERVLMDHHIGPDIKSLLCISYPELSSTSEVVFRVVWQLGGFDKLS
ncbi:MAG: DHH family phosphoesterase, partial [Prevotellaceae bacterium]|nr:DHH family phosphoesterase [Prevotellaceae bacterium]